ncbi:MAG: histidine kinase [Lautropia sp.]|nr:histidine kinase [Lautropia sp.]
MNSTQPPQETSKSTSTPSSAGNPENYKDLDEVPANAAVPAGATVTFVPVSPAAVAAFSARAAPADGSAGEEGSRPEAEAAPGAGSASAATGAASAAASAGVAAGLTAAAAGAAQGAAAGNPSASAPSGGATAGGDSKESDQERAARARRQSEGAPAPVIPDFCNLGIANRAMGILHLGLLAMILMQPRLWAGVEHQLNQLVPLIFAFEVPAVLSLVLLCRVRKFANGLPLYKQWLVGLGLPVLVTMTVSGVLQVVTEQFEPPRHVDSSHAIAVVLANGVAAALIALALYKYFRLRARAMAPSFSEARLQALQARIRPHFLFNSLNTVLGLIRSDPKKAESTLENLADLFRVFMRDARELVPLDDEVITCKEYLAIEKLRLAPRLAVEWDTEGMPGDALLPSLLLQPLLENAVHHGIEPRTDTGVLNIKIRLVGERVRVEVDNPISATVASRPGNQMALSNVRERLMLLYDTEAELRTGPQGDRYHVLLEFPYRKERRRRDVRRHFNPDR